MANIVELILITLIPALELRASIPYGILNGISWPVVFAVCVITNIILGIVVYIFIDKFIILIRKIKFIEKIWNEYVNKIQRKIEKNVDRWGEGAIAIFIGIPLPGSGVYSGGLAAYLIGLDFKKFIISNIIGVLIAGIVVTAIMLTGVEVFHFFIKPI